LFNLKKMDAEVFTKSSTNIYYPTGLKVKAEYCSTIGNEAVLKITNSLFPLAGGVRLSATLIPTCPLNGTYSLNVTVPLILLDPTFVPSGDHRWDVTFRLANGKLVYKYQVSVYAHGSTFRKT
jgi:hypothetical protein